jgi:hypothetical protein
MRALAVELEIEGCVAPVFRAAGGANLVAFPASFKRSYVAGSLTRVGGGFTTSV